MKRILFSGLVLFLFSFFAVGCNNDNDDNSGPSGGNNNNPGDTTSVEDPTLTIILSGSTNDTITFTMTGGIATEQSIIGTHNPAAMGLLSINAAELPLGWSLNLIANTSTFSEGTFEASGVAGYGTLSNTSSGEGFIATSSSITITELELVQDVVNATYNAWGSFELEMEDQMNSGETVEATGTFSNISITVN
jgi:hypothetical protein